jgi:hypothetical protein
MIKKNVTTPQPMRKQEYQDLMELLQNAVVHPDHPITVWQIKFLVVSFRCI